MKHITYPHSGKEFVLAVSVLKSRPNYKSQAFMRVDKKKSSEYQ